MSYVCRPCLKKPTRRCNQSWKLYDWNCYFMPLLFRPIPQPSPRSQWLWEGLKPKVNNTCLSFPGGESCRALGILLIKKVRVVAAILHNPKCHMRCHNNVRGQVQICCVVLCPANKYTYTNTHNVQLVSNRQPLLLDTMTTSCIFF